MKPANTFKYENRLAKSVSTKGGMSAAVSVAVTRSVGASTTRQIDDAVASLSIELSDEEIRALEAPYTPRHDFQGISDDAEMQAIMARLPQFTIAS